MACRTSVIPTRLSSIVRPKHMTTETRTITGFRSTLRKFPISGMLDRRPDSERMRSPLAQVRVASEKAAEEKFLEGRSTRKAAVAPACTLIGQGIEGVTLM